MDDDARNPCLNCGACCAFYRASFYWAEADDVPGGAVPLELTVDLTPFRRAMKGTDARNPRCIALAGIIGLGVHCAIYVRRPGICRRFPASWAEGEPNDMCDRARRAWGLEPLTPESWGPPRRRPRAA